MKVTETSTTTWAKIWSSDAMKKKNNGKEVAFRSNPVAQDPIFANAQNVSRSLKESFDIDDQIRQSKTEEPTAYQSITPRNTLQELPSKAKSKYLVLHERDDEEEDASYSAPSSAKRQALASSSKNPVAKAAPGPSKSSVAKLWDVVNALILQRH